MLGGLLETVLLVTALRFKFGLNNIEHMCVYIYIHHNTPYLKHFFDFAIVRNNLTLQHSVVFKDKDEQACAAVWSVSIMIGKIENQ